MGNSITIEWSPLFEVGHARIDSEHRVFFDIIKSIDVLIREGGDVMKVLRLLRELKLYTEFHFTSEENIMEDHGYPDIMAHRRGHAEVLQELNSHVDDICRGINRLSSLIPFLFHWFASHTVSEDTKLSKYVAGKSVTDTV
ncbi:hypothetical protein A6A04_05635 [Paramagnetospirillum marisnigri]|uniref:Hemerythrin-like domain-containing protein n=2 Tax=Paramagnetospirillum marisnigri TaxID=1285242 RepID=A0A178MFC8_9PROT|nr:hypothetical protein A6A04_05635 [Paramagnetospirillum marisnigri]